MTHSLTIPIEHRPWLEEPLADLATQFGAGYESTGKEVLVRADEATLDRLATRLDADGIDWEPLS